MSKCNAKFHQICSDEKIKSCTSDQVSAGEYILSKCSFLAELFLSIVPIMPQFRNCDTCN